MSDTLSLRGGLLWVLLFGCNAYDVKLVSPDRERAGLDAGERDASMLGMDARVAPSAGIGGMGGDGGRGGAGGAAASDEPEPPDLDGGHRDGSSDDAGDRDASSDAALHDAGDGGTDDGCRAQAVASYCDQLPELPLAALIDGEVDCELTKRVIDPQGWTGLDVLPSNHSTEIAAAFREDGLYLYVEVQDPTLEPHDSGDEIYCGDAVEIYLDADGVIDPNGLYSDPGTMQFVVAAPSASAPGAPDARRYVAGVERAWPAPMLATKVLPDGYAIEAFFSAADMGLAAWTPAARVGLDVGVGVSGTGLASCGNRVGQYFLRVDPNGGICVGEPWCDSQAFCLPTLEP